MVLRMRIVSISRIPLILLIAVFLSLDFTLLYLNFKITKEVENNAQLLNITGRQRMLSQQIAKTILLINNDEDPNNSPFVKELQLSTQLFNQTLNAMQSGGMTINAQGEPLIIPPIEGLSSLAIFHQGVSLWSSTYRDIHTYIQSPNQDNLQKLLLYTQQGNTQLLDIMNTLSVFYENTTKEHTSQFRKVQLIIFILALVNFFIIASLLNYSHKNNQQFLSNLSRLLQDLPQAIFLIDHRNKIIATNPTTHELYAKTKASFQRESIKKYLTMPLNNGPVIINGQHMEITISSVTTLPHEIRLISLLNVTESKVLKQKSLYDPLTELLNRNGLMEAFSLSAKTCKEITCLFLDLDRFKSVNDSYGHSTGDEVLRIVAKKLKSCLKTEDIVSRFGGDEFVILLTNQLSQKDINELYDRIKACVASLTDLKLSDRKITIDIGVSIGIRKGYPSDESLDVIIDDADKAMYVDKACHRTQKSS